MSTTARLNNGITLTTKGLLGLNSLSKAQTGAQRAQAMGETIMGIMELLGQ